LGPFELYSTAFYFTMTTITTVGYGDISGFTSVERVICIFLMLIGVLAYSFASGSLTQIIANYDKISQRNQHKIDMLN
jgi:Trk-type K+ transport system membrane component